jgi:hypothetical protein
MGTTFFVEVQIVEQNVEIHIVDRRQKVDITTYLPYPT